MNGLYDQKIGPVINFLTHLSVDSVLWRSVSVILIFIIRFLMFFSDFCIFNNFVFFVFFRIFFSKFCTLGELYFLDGGFLDLVVFGFRFWNLKPSYKFLNKSNYPLPLPLRIKIVCPDFTISTHYTSCFTITYQGSTDQNVSADLSTLKMSVFTGKCRFCPVILWRDNFNFLSVS